MLHLMQSVFVLVCCRGGGGGVTWLPEGLRSTVRAIMDSTSPTAASSTTVAYEPMYFDSSLSERADPMSSLRNREITSTHTSYTSFATRPRLT